MVIFKVIQAVLVCPSGPVHTRVAYSVTTVQKWTTRCLMGPFTPVWGGREAGLAHCPILGSGSFLYTVADCPFSAIEKVGGGLRASTWLAALELLVVDGDVVG